MLAALTATEMRDLDNRACAHASATALMRRAGDALAALILNSASDGTILGIAGPGNNGGDVFAALASLPSSYKRIVYTLSTTPQSDARCDAEQRALAAGVEVRSISDGTLDAAITTASVILDGIVGIGAHFPLSSDFQNIIDAINASSARVIAVDVPSGIDPDSGAIHGRAVSATDTLTLGALKIGLLLDPARSCVGNLYLHDLGITPALLATTPHAFASMDASSFLATLPNRDALADKRSSGAVFLIAGSRQFPGAAVLAARGALRAGAGYVTLATPSVAAPNIRAHSIESIVMEWPDDASTEEIIAELLDAAQRHGAIGIGPGLGLDERTGEIVRGILTRTTQPCVVDASALFHLSKHLDILRGKEIILTPHAGEFARLSGAGTIATGTRVQRLRSFVAQTGIVTLLKGRDTLIVDGTCCAINATGTNVLAIAGSGDVLTGMIASLLARGVAPAQAGILGAYWHGLAGQSCAKARSVGTIASDLPEALAHAITLARERAISEPFGTLLAPG